MSARYVIQGGDAVSTSIHIGDVANDPPHSPGPGYVSAQGGQTDYREA